VLELIYVHLMSIGPCMIVTADE